MTKDVVPEHFTLGLALVDFIPVILFGLSFIFLAVKLKSILFGIGAGICLFAGLSKVIWKIIVVLTRKNVWFLFIQLRFLMPLGFLIMILALILCSSQINLSAVWLTITSFPQIIFLSIGIFGMICMMIFGFVLDSSNVIFNWIEQIVNCIAQLAFFVLILISL